MGQYWVETVPNKKGIILLWVTYMFRYIARIRIKEIQERDTEFHVSIYIYICVSVDIGVQAKKIRISISIYLFELA